MSEPSVDLQIHPDPDAAPGRLLPALARLLRQLAERQPAPAQPVPAVRCEGIVQHGEVAH